MMKMTVSRSAWLVFLAVLVLTGCGAAEEPTVRIADGAVVKAVLKLTVEGKEAFSHTEDQPFSYTHGDGSLPPGLERELAGLAVGDERKITVTPADGFGEPDPALVTQVPIDEVPEGKDPVVGQIIEGNLREGGKFHAVITEVTAEYVVLDRNHPFAGKTLEFEVRILEISLPEG